MSDRGMKKWAPYKSLPEKDLQDAKMKKKRNIIEKPLISNEEAEDINYLLLNHNNNELKFTVFKSGKLIEVIGIIKNIDEINRKVILVNNEKILLKDIVGLEKIG